MDHFDLDTTWECPVRQVLACLTAKGTLQSPASQTQGDDSTRPNIDKDQIKWIGDFIWDDVFTLSQIFKDPSTETDWIEHHLLDIQFQLITLVGILHLHHHFEWIFEGVHQSNLIKKCYTHGETIKTHDRYEAKGETTRIMAPNPNTYLVTRLSDGKTLKNINYIPPDITKFISHQTGLNEPLTSIRNPLTLQQVESFHSLFHIPKSTHRGRPTTPDRGALLLGLLAEAFTGAFTAISSTNAQYQLDCAAEELAEAHTSSRE